MLSTISSFRLPRRLPQDSGEGGERLLKPLYRAPNEKINEKIIFNVVPGKS